MLFPDLYKIPALVWLKLESLFNLDYQVSDQIQSMIEPF